MQHGLSVEVTVSHPTGLTRLRGMKHSPFYFHLDTDGGNSTEIEARVHGCLPENVGLAFALGTLKRGGIDPDTVSHSAAEAGVTQDHVIKLRRSVFSAFNTCLARYLAVCLEPQLGDYAGVGRGCTTRSDASVIGASTSLSSSSCQLCSIIGRMALHAAACKLHYVVCSDQCLPMFNLVGYHLGSCKRSICNATLCDELRMALLEQQPVEPPGDGLDRAWHQLCNHLACVLLPPPAADVLELFRRYSGLQTRDICCGINGSDAMAQLTSDSVSLGPAPWKCAPLTVGANWVRGSSSREMGLATDCGTGDDIESSCTSSSSSVGDVGSGSSSSSARNPSVPKQQQHNCGAPSLAGRVQPGTIPTGEELEEFLMQSFSPFLGLTNVEGERRCSPARDCLRTGDCPKDAEVPPGCSALGNCGTDNCGTLGGSDSTDDRLPKLSLLIGSQSSLGGASAPFANLPAPGEAVHCSQAEATNEQWKQQLLHQAGSSLSLPRTMLPLAASSRQSGRLDSGIKILGQGSVAYGEPRHLLDVVRYWKVLQERLQDRSPSNVTALDDVDSDVWEGIILMGKDGQFSVRDGNYQKRVHWLKQIFLGRGVCGHVELAIDKHTEFNFVVKKVELCNFSHDELSIWAELEHPGIVQLYGALRHGRKLYYLCELYAGQTLTALIQRSRALDQWKALFYLEQILTVLAYLQEKKIIHEDLKADNIFLKPGSQFLGVGDFGLSCKLRSGQNSVVAGKQPLGGQTQWSPEKARSDGHGVSADVWAAMCTMVHMLSGHHPWELRFKGCHMLHYVIALNSPPVDDIPVGLLDEVKDLILSGWTMDPHCRPTAAELLRHRAFDHLRNGCPSDSMYSDHFRYLQPANDDNSECSTTDSYNEENDELDEDGEQYFAEIVEMSLRQSGVAGTGSAPLAAGSAQQSYLLPTEFDLMTCSGGRMGGIGKVDGRVVTAADERADGRLPTAGKAAAPTDRVLAAQQQGDVDSGADAVQLGADGLPVVPPPQSHGRAAAGRDSHVLARRWLRPADAIEEEPSDASSEMACSKRSRSPEQSSSPSFCWPHATSGIDALVLPPLLSSAGTPAAATSAAAAPESPIGSDEVRSSSSGGSGAASSGRLRRSKGPGLFVNVHAATSGSSPLSPSLRHSYSVDSGETPPVKSPPTCDSGGSNGGEGKRFLKHAVTSPSILVPSRTASADYDKQQAALKVLQCERRQQPLQRQQRGTPPSAGGLSLGLSSADLSAADGGSPCQQPTSSAYGSASTPSRAPSVVSSCAWDLRASNGSSSSVLPEKTPPRRGSSQGYGTGCTPDSGGSVFPTSAPHSGNGSRAAVKPGFVGFHQDVSPAAAAAVEPGKACRNVEDENVLNNDYIRNNTAVQQPVRQAGCTGRLRNDGTAVPIVPSFPTVPAIVAAKDLSAIAVGEGGCNRSSSGSSGSTVHLEQSVGLAVVSCALLSDTGLTVPATLPGTSSSGVSATTHSSVDPLSLAAALDLGCLTTSSSDVEFELLPDAVNGLAQSQAGSEMVRPDPVELNLCLPEKQDLVHGTNEVDADKEDKEFLSMLQQSIKQSYSNVCLSSAHAVLIAGDGSRMVSKGQEIGKLKISPEMTWQDGVLLMSRKVHEKGFDSYTVVFEDGGELPLHDKIPVQTVTLTVKLAADCDPGQWWIANNELKFSEEGHHGLFLDSRS